MDKEHAALRLDADGRVLGAAWHRTQPEGAVISLPLRAEGRPKPRAFAAGVLSGAVEPLGAALTIAAAQLIVPALPYLLGFAAGAMLYVVAVELLPTAARGGALSAAVGFTVMMVLDVALG